MLFFLAFYAQVLIQLKTSNNLSYIVRDLMDLEHLAVNTISFRPAQYSIPR
jgi:hypothetical protein